MDLLFRNKLRSILIHHEALRLLPYVDTKGFTTIGVGRNLTTRGITENEAFFLLDDDMQYFDQKLTQELEWYPALDDARKVALIDMAFMGIKTLLEFTEMLEALKMKNWEKAAQEALASRWAQEVGQRATDIAEIFRTGIITCV